MTWIRLRLGIIATVSAVVYVIGGIFAPTIASACEGGSEEKSSAEGPLFKVEGNALKVSEKKEIIAAIAGNSIEMRVVGEATSIVCKKLALKAGAAIEGTPKGNFDANHETIEYAGCEVKGNGEGCVISSVAGAKNKQIKTQPLESALAYTSGTKAKGTIVDMLFKPVSPELLAKVNFEPEPGGKCTVKETSMERSMGAEVGVNGGPVKVGTNEPEAETVEVDFPGAGEVFLEEGGVLSGTKPALFLFGKEATVTGKTTVKALKKAGEVYKEWGVHTK